MLGHDDVTLTSSFQSQFYRTENKTGRAAASERRRSFGFLPASQTREERIDSSTEERFTSVTVNQLFNYLSSLNPFESR
jgi:hypothetical protein